MYICIYYVYVIYIMWVHIYFMCKYTYVHMCTYICVRTYVYIMYIHTHIVFTKYCGKPLTSKLFTFLFF